MIKLILSFLGILILVPMLVSCATTGQDRVHLYKPEKVYPQGNGDKNIHHVPFKKITGTRAMLGGESVD